MKKAFTLVLLLAAMSILLSSCGLISNTSITKSHNSGSFYVEPDDVQKSAPIKGNLNTFQMKGDSYISTDKQDVKNNPEENSSLLTENQPLLASSFSTEKRDNIDAVGNDFISTPVVKSDNLNSTKIISENKNIPNISQKLNYSESSGRPSNGVPFWLIVIFAFFIPPLGVALMYGITDKFWICLVLTLLFWLPGMIYAMIQIFK